MTPERRKLLRDKAVTVFELTKGYTQEQRQQGNWGSNTFHTMEEMAGYVLELTNGEYADLRCKPLAEALLAAVQVIKDWHSADQVWQIYYDKAPEMKIIREALQDYNKNK